MTVTLIRAYLPRGTLKTTLMNGNSSRVSTVRLTVFGCVVAIFETAEVSFLSMVVFFIAG